MSVSKLGILLFSSFLIFATAPLSLAQSTQNQTQDQTTKKKQKSTTNKETGKTTQQNGTTPEPVATSVNDVKQIQMALVDLGYNPGEVNGMMSTDTRQAIRQFQWLNGLAVNGIIDQQTKNAIDAQETGSAQNAQLGQTPLSSEREKPAQDKTDHSKHHDQPTGKSEKGAAGRINKAAAVLHDLTGSSDNRIPNQLLERAEAIVVIPHMVKGALGVGGRYGKGVVSERAENGRWSPPAFMDIGGGSYGLQIGASATDLVLVFTDRKALETLENGKELKLGVDAGIVAGPIGRSAEAGTNAKLESAVYAYSRSKGLFAGVALDGAVLYIDNDMNRKVYGDSVDSRQILSGKVAANSTVQPFMRELETAVPKKRISQK
jgi:lipid-binding SYLF domain-containing protein